jgi:nucleotide-binding universal stress UspA family protein
MRILLALDGSAHSQRALDFVSRMRWPAGSRLIVLNILEPALDVLASGDVVTGAPPMQDDAGRQRAERIVADSEARLREVGFATEGQVVTGIPGDAVVEAATRERADLVVMGSRGRTGVAKWVLGSVSSHVVTHAPCSVLVVKHGRTK